METRPLSLILACVVLSAAAGAIAAFVVAPSAPVKAGGAAEPNRDAQIAGALSRLEARQGEIEKELGELRALASSAGSRSEVADVDAAIERWMQAHAEQLAARAQDDSIAPNAADARTREQRIAAAVEQILHGDLSDVEQQQLWRELSKDGLGDALLAEFERRAELDPNNADKKVDLAGVYFLKLTEVGNSPEAGVWATKADKLLDQALEIDSNHWEARFSKAVALSFWPPVFGKQKESIAHFETLVAQQANQPKRDEFAQTHLLLGNMYQQIGQTDKAVAAWQAGLAQFPDDANLHKQLELYGAH